MKRKNKKSSKNAITAGVLITLYMVVYIIIGAISMPLPFFFLLMPIVIAFFSTPIYHLLVAKTKSHTAILLLATLPHILFIIMGHLPIALVVSIPIGFLASYVARKKHCADFRQNAISHLIFSQNLLGGFLPIWLFREMFFQRLIEGKLNPYFIETIRAFTPLWALFVMIFGIFCASLLGSYFTKKIFKKKLQLAGVW